MKKVFLLLMFFVVAQIDASACTSAAVSAARSSEGVPLLWKHRDSKFSNTRVDYVSGGKYAYTAVVPNNDEYRGSIYAGINEKGLAFMSLTTYSLPCATEEEWKACTRKNAKGSMQRLGLRNCATVDEFEDMLRTTKRKNKYNSNIGVADGTGAAAYFEIWDLGYRRYDVSEREEGFDVRANFSFADTLKGKRNASERRYNLIMKEMSAHKGKFTPQQLIGYSRSYNSIKFGNVLENNDKYYCANHTVPRSSTVGAFVMVCDAKCPRMLVMNGHSVSSLAVPVYVQAGTNIPKCVHGDAMRLLSNDFKAKAYIKTKSGRNRLNKEVVRAVLNIKQPEVAMPSTMPAKIVAFNARVDKTFSKHEKRVRKVLAKF